MRQSRWLLALTGLLPGMVSACGTKVDGQLMLAVQTDMALPKDIDQIRIEVLRAKTGGVIFQNDYFKFGNGDDKAIRLPATLGIIASEDASEAVKIRVIASHGSAEKPKVKVLREVVTTVPTDRTATLPLTIEFLCDGSAEVERDPSGQIKRDPSGNVIVKNACPGDLTCVAGACKPSAVPEAMLPTFEAKAVFGGGTGTGDGTCFDVAKCFDEGTDVKIDLDTFKSDSTLCQAQAEVSDNINVALRTQGAGICGKSGCFVALNADSDTGWKPGSSGKILLPPKVCEKAAQGEIVGVVTAPVEKETCQKKQLSVPTCGPWSAVGGGDPKPPDPKLPAVIASGQSNPLSLFVARGNVYWTSRGTFDDQGTPKPDGAVKAAPIAGGQPKVIAAGQASPHGLAGDDGKQLLLWTNASDGTIQWAPFLDEEAPMPAMPPKGKALINGRLQPEGIAVFGSMSGLSVYWTELASNKVFHVDASVDGSGELSASGQGVELEPLAPQVFAPRGITATRDGACWTYEDKLKSSSGVVGCSFSNKTVLIASGERTPRAIATGAGPGNTTRVYWGNFDAASTGGGIFMMPLLDGVPQGTMKETIASEDYPAGLLVDVDGGTLYWTSRSQGTVMRLRAGETKPTAIATGQQNPGALAVDKDAVYWINEGASDAVAPVGAIMRVAKN